LSRTVRILKRFKKKRRVPATGVDAWGDAVPSQLARFLPVALLLFLPPTAGAQQSAPPPILNLGDAVVTGFSGTLAPPQRRPSGKSAADLTFIDPDGPSVRVIDLSHPGHVWQGQLFDAPKSFTATAKDVGQVFGVALDDQAPPNIYVAATSAFGLNLVSRARNGRFERRRKGGPGAAWMKGQFGLDLQGGPGAIYRIDGRTGVATLFANVTLDGVPNPAPGLGNLAYDAAHRQLFVSDLYTGMIHRFDLDGRDLSRYDHGVTGLAAANLPTRPFDPKKRPNIATARFDTEKPDTWGYAPAARRVFGLAVHQGRLYYSVAAGPQIWSVGIARDGSFANDPRWELDVPAQAGPLPVSDIAFSHKGAMILAQRAPVAGAYDYTAFTHPGEPRLLRFWLKDRNDPPSPGRWKPAPEEYAVGFAGTYRNTNGGVALGYGYGRDGVESRAACEYALWTTGQNLRNAPALKDKLDPGGPLVVHGIMGMPAGPVRDINTPPWLSYTVAYGDEPAGDPRASGHMGSIRIYTQPCASPALYSGPGYPANPPYIATVAGPPPICAGRDCSPRPCAGPNCPHIIDVKLDKKIVTRDGPHVTFEIDVTNVGDAITGGNFTITDNVPNGMTVMSVSGPWTCGPVPITGPGALTCTYTAGSVPANTTLPGIVLTTVATTQDWKNCAVVALTSQSGQDGNPSNDKGCASDHPDNHHYVLYKKEVVSHVQGYSAPPLTFAVGITCSNGVSTTLNLASDGTAQSVGNLPIGTNCTANEPAVTVNACPQGMTTVWDPPTYTPSATASAAMPGPTVTITNSFDCKEDGNGGASVQVKKQVACITACPPPMTFPVTVTCNGTPTTLNVSSDGTPQSVSGLAPNTPCHINEPTPTANACPQGQTTVWGTPTYSPSNTVNAATPGPIVTVTNPYDCQPSDNGGSIQVKKEVVANLDGYSFPQQTFPVTVTCNGTSTTLNLSSDGTPQSVGNLPVGTQCTIHEPTPPLPNACPYGMTPTWGTPSYVPANTATAAVSPPTVTVSNPFSCKQGGDTNGGGIRVQKVIEDDRTFTTNVHTLFPITVTCGGTTVPASIQQYTETPVTGLPLGATCTVSETTPLPAPPTTGCANGTVPTWGAVSSIPASVAAGSGSGPLLTVKNVLYCAPSNGNGNNNGGDDTGYLLVTKKVVNNANAPLNGMTFSIVANCGMGDQQMNLADAAHDVVHAVPVGNTCTVTEPTLPPPPSGGSCPEGQRPGWTGTTIVQTPPGPMISGMGPAVMVTNTLDCVGTASLAPPPPPKLVCKAPLVPNARGTACVCGKGWRRRGKTCVRQVVCHAPAKLNRRGTGCDCPKDYVKKGNSCVRRKHDERRVNPDDIIRVLPGVIPGFGGHRGGGDNHRGGGDSGGGGGGGAGPKGVR
jgi:uncharacterized repeat protein (TIGR01451 family)